MILHVVASGEMRRRRISKRGNHAAFCAKTTLVAKRDEIATSLILARWLGFTPRNDVRVAAPNLFGAGLLKTSPNEFGNATRQKICSGGFENPPITFILNIEVVEIPSSPIIIGVCGDFDPPK